MSCNCNETTRNYYKYYDTPDGCDVLKKYNLLGCGGQMPVAPRKNCHSGKSGLEPDPMITWRNGQGKEETITTTRYGAITGVIFGSYDVLFYSHAVGFIPVLKRYAYHVVPLALMGATFSVVANSALQMRKKDGPINYLLGGLACGPILGAYLRSGHAMVLGGLALGVIGMLKKDAVDHNFTIFPVITSHMGTIRKWRHDHTMVVDPLDELRHSCGKDDD